MIHDDTNTPMAEPGVSTPRSVPGRPARAAREVGAARSTESPSTSSDGLDEMLDEAYANRRFGREHERDLAELGEHEDEIDGSTLIDLPEVPEPTIKYG